MNRRLRWGLWLGMLGIASALVIADHGGTSAPGIVQDVAPEVRAPAAQPVATRAAVQAPGEIATILPLRPRTGAARIANAFAAQDWTPPPPPPKPIVLPPPSAPAVPYTVLGKKFEDGQWQVFLTREDQVFVVKDRDTIENLYRVETTRPPLMTLTYLPLQQRQTLPIGEAQ